MIVRTTMEDREDSPYYELTIDGQEWYGFCLMTDELWCVLGAMLVNDVFTKFWLPVEEARKRGVI